MAVLPIDLDVTQAACWLVWTVLEEQRSIKTAMINGFTDLNSSVVELGAGISGSIEGGGDIRNNIEKV